MNDQNQPLLITESELLQILRLPETRSGKRRFRRWLRSVNVKSWRLKNLRLFSLPEVLVAMEVSAGTA
jgi:hypothetical protein